MGARPVVAYLAQPMLGRCDVYLDGVPPAERARIVTGLALGCSASESMEARPGGLVLRMRWHASPNRGGAGLREDLRLSARNLRDRARATIRAAGYTPRRAT